MTEISGRGDIEVEGHLVGRLAGLRFEAASTARTLEGRAVRNAALAAVLPILSERLEAICAAPAAAFSLDGDGRIVWNGEPVAVLERGSCWLKPGVRLIGGDEAAHDFRERARLAILAWVQGHVGSVLAPLVRLAEPDATSSLPAAARGLAFRLAETGAAIDLRQDDPPVRIEAGAREALKALGLRAGRVCAHVPEVQKRAAQRLAVLLRTVHDGAPCQLAPEGAGSFAPQADWSDAQLLANGYLRLGRRAVRADLAERLAWDISKRRKEAGKNLFALPPELASIISSPGDDFPDAVRGLGLVPAEKDPETGRPTLWRYGQKGARATPTSKAPKSPVGRREQTVRPKPAAGSAERSAPRRAADPSSPFAALAALLPDPHDRRPPPRRRKPRSRPANAAAVPEGEPSANPKGDA